MLKAIYTGKSKSKSNIYEYERKTNKFHMKGERNNSQEFSKVINSSEFTLFSTSGDVWRHIKDARNERVSE